MSDGRRVQRVAEAIKLHLAGALLRELGDPLLQSLVVTHVDVTPDLRTARIAVRLLADDQDEQRRKAALRAVRRAGGRIRRALAPKLGLRYFPELSFSYDTGHDAERRVEELLDEIARARAPESDDPADPAD